MTTSVSFGENDIRPEQMMVDKQQCVEADRQFLLDHHDQWVSVPCPACQADNPRPFGEKQGFAYVECEKCGTVYTNPRPSQAVLDEFYATSQNYAYWNRYIFPATAEVRRDRIFRPRAERLMDYCHTWQVSSGVLLEVGAAFGIFCEEVLKTGYFDRVIALEPTPDLAQTCRDKGLEVMESPIEKVEGRAIAHVIAAFEVIEHLFSPIAFIQQCEQLLHPNGLLVLSCPNVRGFDVATLKTRSGTFDHEHINYFHPHSLPHLLKTCGFDLLDVQTPGKLDAELVRKAVLKQELSLESQPFLQTVLLDRWEELGQTFQEFLAANCLSSHMWVVAKKPGHATL